jgi:hydrogenase maturation protein HypF
MCTEAAEALARLRGIADVWLVHNRPIVQHVDDSIVRVMAGRELVLRRARGYAPFPIVLQQDLPAMLAVGGHLKNTTALTSGRHVFLSQHIGDLETPEAFGAFRRVLRSFQTMYNVRPRLIACDAHPDYLSSTYARESRMPIVPVQHHYAHVLACMAEHHLQGRVLGVAWDGSGYGPDGSVWGGEFLLVTDAHFRRAGHFRKAIQEPRRTALGALYEIFGESVFARDDLLPVRAFSAAELRLLRQILLKRLNTPVTSSVGRLFDAVTSLLGLRQQVSFEGQAAMALEFAMADIKTEASYPFLLRHGALHPEDGASTRGAAPLEGSTANAPSRQLVIDWEPLLRAIIDDVRTGVCTQDIAARFHNTLVEAIVAMAECLGERRVVLTGGCFQNKYLTERAVRRLTVRGFRPYWHQRVPPNDGGIALGQVVAAAARIKE